MQKVQNNLSALVFGANDFTPSDLLDPAVAFASVTGCVIVCNYIFRFVYECCVFTCVWTQVFRAQAVFLLAVKGQEQCKKDCSRSEQYTKRLSLYMCVCLWVWEQEPSWRVRGVIYLLNFPCKLGRSSSICKSDMFMGTLFLCDTENYKKKQELSQDFFLYNCQFDAR